MIPIFSSLDMMKRALQVNQEAIQTTGNNISNANTDGYSRERVNQTEWTAYPSIGIDSPKGAGQIGTGVTASSVVRIHDQFVDQQVRDNSNQNGYWSAVSDAYSQMEDIVNETSSDDGISTALNNFWSSLQDLAGNTGTSGTGSTVLEDGAGLADTFNYIASSLSKVQNNLSSEITENTSLVNSYADQINSLNQEINQQEANGMLPNDLYDQRDALVDKLSTLVNVKVSTVKSGGTPSADAEGLYTIEIVDKDGNSYTPPATLVDGSSLTDNHLVSDQETGTDGYPTVNQYLVSSSDDTTKVGPTSLTDMSGQIQGEIDAYTTDFPETLKSLNNMASTLAANFNAAYAASSGGNTSGKNFFIASGSDPTAPITAANIEVNPALSGSDITANENGSASGDNSAATAMADVLESTTYDVDGTQDESTDSSASTLQNYLAGLIGQIGVNSQTAQQLETNSNSLLTAAQNQQSSISGVSTDEELTNLIQYQQSYSAAAKVVTTLDTMLDTLINNMGS